MVVLKNNMVVFLKEYRLGISKKKFKCDFHVGDDIKTICDCLEVSGPF